MAAAKLKTGSTDGPAWPVTCETSPSEPQPFEIADAGDMRVAANGRATLQISGDEGGLVFRRRAQKLNVRSGLATSVEWAVADLDGVRVYFDGQNVVVTRRDLMP